MPLTTAQHVSTKELSFVATEEGRACNHHITVASSSIATATVMPRSKPDTSTQL